VIRELAHAAWACEQDDGPRIVRQVVIAGTDAVLVVDTGLPDAPGSDLLPLVERLGPRAPIVLVTHPDADHLGGTAELLRAWPRARVLAGAADAPLVGDPERLLAERYARFAATDDVPFSEEAAERSRGRTGPPFAGVEPVGEAAELDLGGRRVELVATPGHSPGHTAAWVPDAGLLAAGDAVMGTGIPTRSGSILIPPMYAPPATYRATVARVAALAPRLLATGHDPIRRDDEIADFLVASDAAVERLEALVFAAVEEGPATLFELCRRVHASYGGLPPDRVADLALTVDGHLGELAERGLVASEPGPPRRFRSSS
jgi:glyoxylase-like metal-dependent hydrolase (beta-lactamase superfamily II)